MQDGYMVPVINKVTNESSGISTTFGFSAKVENLGTLFHILRSQLYSDPILAVIREYACNSFDANVAANKKTTPIRVSLPTILDCFFKVRDYGDGLTDEQVQEIFCSYGESTKRKSNEQVGMLGIGCKSGFAYNDSFLVNSYRDGKLTVWNCFLDPSNRGAMSKMCDTETTEPNGLEIVIPVKAPDIAKFIEKSLNFFAYWPILPQFVNINDAELQPLKDMRNRVARFSGDGYKFFGNTGNSFVVMGNIAYPIHLNVFTDAELTPEMRQILSNSLVLDFKLGELEFAASREALQFTPHTKKHFITRLESVVKDIVKQASETFTKCPTLWDAKALWNDVFDLHGKLYSVRNLFTRNLKWNGLDLNSNKFSAESITNHYDVQCSVYLKVTGAKMRRQDTQQIEASAKHYVVINEDGICNGIVNRLAPIIEAGPMYSRVYVLKFADDKVKAQWLKNTGYDGPLISLKTLPKESLSKYYGSLSSGVTGFISPKHTAQEFVYDKTNVSRYSNRSDYWKLETVDVTKDTGVYLEIERFEYKDHNSYHQHPTSLSSVFDKLKMAGIAAPSKVYGLKPNSVNKAKNNANMVPFWKWLETAVADYCTNHPELLEELANRDYAKQVVSSWFDDMDGVAVAMLKWKAVRGDLRKFFETVRKLHSFDETKIDRLRDLIHIGRYNAKTVTKFDLKKDFKALEQRYPLMFQLVSKLRAWNMSEPEYEKSITQYITLVDGTSLTGITVNEGEGI